MRPRLALCCLTALICLGPWGSGAEEPKVARPGIKDVQVAFETLKPIRTFRLRGRPDWMVVTDDAIWISNDRLNSVHRIDPVANRVTAEVHLPGTPCSGLAFGFGSIWVPLCDKAASLARVDAKNNKVTEVLPIGPVDSEGGITASADSIWVVTDKLGTLVRIDPATKQIRQRISVPPGSYNPLYSDGIVWVSCVESNLLTAVNAASGAILAQIPVGPHPRFLTVGEGSIWTLNQGDGTVSRVDAHMKRVTATISVGIPGTGGEICYGAGMVWTSVFDVPLTRIDAKSNAVVRQWTGSGGDSVRFAYGSLWVTDYHEGLLWRITEGEALLR